MRCDTVEIRKTEKLNNAETPRYGAHNLTELPLKHYEERFLAANFEEIAERTGFLWDGGGFLMPYFEDTVRVSRGEGTDFVAFSSGNMLPGRENALKEKEKILLLRLLLEGRKTPETAVFRAYNELPWGDVYDRQFRGRCISRLAAVFGNRVADFEAACLRLNGRKIPGSGVTFEIPFMPGLLIRLILWEGDDEFPSSGQILFSENFGEALSAEDRVIVTEILLGKMK